MIDEQNAITNIMSFLSDKNKKSLLVRGYDNEAKLKVVISCLNREFDMGIIRSSSMSDISNHINQAFNKKLLPHTIKSTTTYKLGKMTINFNSYATHTTSNPRGNENTFTLFFPVQLVLNDPKRYTNFLNELNETKSRKIILIRIGILKIM